MRALEAIALPIIGAALAIGAWAAAVALLHIDPGILPSPLGVLRALNSGLIGGRMHVDIAFTLQASLAGFIIGAATGLVCGLAVGEFRMLNRFIYPVVLAIQSMPTVAIAPLLIVWLGIDIASKMVMVALACFFPVFIATVAGMNAGTGDLVALYRVFAAGRLRTLIEVKLPNALDYVFGGLEIAVMLSFIVCVVAEFVASTKGLGHLIKILSEQLDVSAMFAAIATLAMLGAAAGAVVRGLRSRVVFWRAGARVVAGS
jgi:NitT/TauT family transport system permease protein